MLQIPPVLRPSRSRRVDGVECAKDLCYKSEGRLETGHISKKLESALSMRFETMNKTFGKIGLVIALVASPSVFAANTLDASDGTPSPAVYVDDKGWVGIGTQTPSRPLEVRGDYMLRNNAHGGFFIMQASNGSMELGSGNNENSYIDFKGKNNLTKDFVGRIMFNDTNGFSIMGGNVGIGTYAPESALSVRGKITAQEVEVKQTVAATDFRVGEVEWADYVFKPNYKLASLAEVKRHIDDFGHLPGIPTAKQVREHGLSLGATQAKLLEKIEELTLHVIELDSRLKRFESAKN